MVAAQVWGAFNGALGWCRAAVDAKDLRSVGWGFKRVARAVPSDRLSDLKLIRNLPFRLALNTSLRVGMVWPVPRRGKSVPLWEML